MNDELRKAAQDVLDEWDGPSRVGSWSPLMKSLRAALANNSNAASQDQDAKDAARYRWLRIRPADMNFLSYREAQEIDRRIDDAMEQKP